MADDKTPSAPIAPRTAGYRRPPLGRPFRKGQSGNPAGRPKGSRNRPRLLVEDNQLDTLIRAEASRLIKVSADGGETKLPAVQLVIRAMILAAAKGDLKAQAAFLKIMSDSQNAGAAQMPPPDDEVRDPVATQPHEIIFKILDPGAKEPMPLDLFKKT